MNEYSFNDRVKIACLNYYIEQGLNEDQMTETIQNATNALRQNKEAAYFNRNAKEIERRIKEKKRREKELSKASVRRMF
ncbi:hypothetical protein FACS189454_08230 [Planctomycetales bacterium]|nr:hypothetical protein FACS189454_08230 [Planctomycetales bacterium]